MRRTSQLLGCLSLVLAPSVAFPQRAVHVVDTTGAPGTDHLDLPAALQAAGEGDLVLVRNGLYGELVVDGKGLTIQAEAGGSAFVERVVVRNTTSGQGVFVRGVHLLADTAPAHGIQVTDCAGPVWIEDLAPSIRYRSGFMNGYATTLAPVRVERSGDVVLNRCRLDWEVPAGTDGVQLVDSTTRVFDSRTPHCERATALRVQGGTLFYHGGEIDTLACGVPGDSVVLEGGAVAEFQPSLPSTRPAQVVSGTLDELGSFPRSHESSSPVYEGGTVSVRLTGRPQDRVWVLLSPALTAPRSILGSDAPFFLGLPVQSFFVGQIPFGEDTLELEPAVGDLGPGDVAVDFFLQAVMLRSPANGVHYTEPTLVSLLDESNRQPPYLYEEQAAWEVELGPGTPSFGNRLLDAGDIDGDGFGDVVITDIRHDSVHLFAGEAGGLGTTPVWSQIGTTNFGQRLAAAGDLNADGFADVVLSDGVGNFYVGYGSASGLPAAGLPAYSFVDDGWGQGRLSRQPGDLDGDGFDDLLLTQYCGANCAASSGERYLRFFPGSATGVDLGAPAWQLLVDVGLQNLTVEAAGDVDQDGFPDFVTIEESSGTRVSLYLGGPGLPQQAWSRSFGGAVHALGPGDLDGDDVDDLVIGDQLASELLVFRGLAGGGPLSLPTQAVPSPFFGLGSELFRVGDVDGDGHDDLAFSGELAGSLWSIQRGSTAGLERSPYWELPESAVGQTFVTLSDRNGDGRPELLASWFAFYGSVRGVVRAYWSRP